MKEKTSSNKTDQKTCFSIGLDQIDREILQFIQDNFPLVQEPWLEISTPSKLAETECNNPFKTAN